MIGPIVRAGSVDVRRIMRGPLGVPSLQLDSASLFYGGAAVAAVVVGRAAGLNPLLAIALVVGLALMGVVLGNLTAGLLVFTLVTFLESLPTISGAPSIAKLVGLFLIAGWLAAVASGRTGDAVSRDLLAQNPLLVWTLALFLAWVLFSLLWAEDVVVARTAFLSYALNFALFPIVFAALRTPRHIVWLYSVFIAAALLGVAVGVLSTGGLEGGQDERLSGAGLNANYLGALLAVAAVLAAVLACNRRLATTARIAAIVAAGLCTVFMIMTGSRGALVGLASALLVAPFAAGPGRRLGTLGLVVAAGLSMLVWLSFFAAHDTVERLTHATSSGSGRVDLWTIGLRMVDDKPFTGVGAGNFQVSSIHYLLQPGTIVRAEYIVDEPKVTHNIYLQVLSELGFVGLSLFLAAILICLVCTVRAARTFRQRGDSDSELLARGLLIALVALLAAYFFSSALYSKQLYLLLAMGPALLSIARREPSQAPP